MLRTFLRLSYIVFDGGCHLSFEQREFDISVHDLIHLYILPLKSISSRKLKSLPVEILLIARIN